MFYPFLNLLSSLHVIVAGIHFFLLARAIRSPYFVAQMLWQHEPVFLASPHCWWNLLVASRPVAVMMPVLSLTLDILSLVHNHSPLR